jgi:hypothetical protein
MYRIYRTGTHPLPLPFTLLPFTFFLLPSALLVLAFSLNSLAQGPPPPAVPLTSQELVRLVYELPRHPEKRDEIVESIRQRGIGFPLSDGMRSLVAAKSGSDALLRRTLEEAERRRVNPKTEAPPATAESNELLERTKTATLGAAKAMPDFIVRQLIKRSEAYGSTSNWLAKDTLTIGVSYRQNIGEEYKVLTMNGMPLAQDAKGGSDYSKYVGGTTSSGAEYVTGLASIFNDEARTTFKPVDTDIIRGRRTLVYEYVVRQQFSNLHLKAGDNAEATVGSRGRLWVDREEGRVLRFEQIATEIPRDFPITAGSSLIDFDWVVINEQKHLLPIHADILLTSLYGGGQLVQSRNDVRFRGYQKFGAELKVIDEVDDSDLPPEKPETKKPEKPPEKPTKPPDKP